MYEGTVGNILVESPWTLWERAVERRNDPFLVETLRSVKTMDDWAAACRKIDYHFGSDSVRSRMERRPRFTGLPVGVSPRPAKPTS
jgi:hypothetical protein